MTFQPFDIQYSPHIDVTMNPATGVVSITVAHHPNNQGGYNCRVYDLAPPYTGRPVLTREWEQGKNNITGPFGHGASVVLPTGALLTATPVGINSANNVTPAIQIEPGYSAPYQLGGSTEALEQRLAALATHLADVEAVMHETQNETARVRALAESIGGESLSAGDREALDRLRALLRI